MIQFLLSWFLQQYLGTKGMSTGLPWKQGQTGGIPFSDPGMRSPAWPFAEGNPFWTNPGTGNAPPAWPFAEGNPFWVNPGMGNAPPTWPFQPLSASQPVSPMKKARAVRSTRNRKR
jgi:hypothetical protein